ncbi:hypothetical protein [Fundicoccus culcitae]|uniref:Uncharacterized protein n=1 Tax=Fundicoccus culcitae TaxID=2969821 RepID=A0ABY5P7X0_9LACT|nr:hypothetical protein [Fundicoccus culcitae]UUX34681.1 hypothetical protein NRE15_03240 [Fundicoccus culcitae]
MATEKDTIQMFNFMDESESTAYVCDIETGICGPAEVNNTSETDKNITVLKGDN